MENINWLAIICIGGIFVILAVIVALTLIPGFLIGFSMSKKQNEQRNAESDERGKYHQAIHDNGGVLAPAVILSAGVVKSIGGGKNRSASSYIMDYEVDVTPDGGSPFRTVVREEYFGGGITVEYNEMVSQHGRKIWVMYNPKDTTRAYLHHYDEDHEEAMLDHRRGEFLKLIESNEDLRMSGEQAEAVITHVDDLNLPFPLRKGRAMHFWLDVASKTGSVFQAEGDALVTEAVVKKYSVGKKVFVRLNPIKPEKAALDTEKNKSLQ